MSERFPKAAEECQASMSPLSMMRNYRSDRKFPGSVGCYSECRSVDMLDACQLSLHLASSITVAVQSQTLSDIEHNVKVRHANTCWRWKSSSAEWKSIRLRLHESFVCLNAQRRAKTKTAQERNSSHERLLMKTHAIGYCRVEFGFEFIIHRNAAIRDFHGSTGKDNGPRAIINLRRALTAEYSFYGKSKTFKLGRLVQRSINLKSKKLRWKKADAGLDDVKRGTITKASHSSKLISFSFCAPAAAADGRWQKSIN